MAARRGRPPKVPTGIARQWVRAREAKELERDEAARKMGVPYGTLSAIENGRNSNPTIGLFRKAAELYGVLIDQLAWDHPPALPPPLQSLVAEDGKVTTDEIRDLLGMELTLSSRPSVEDYRRFLRYRRTGK